MRKSFLALIIFSALSAASAFSASAAEPLTLEKAYELALKRSEDIAIKAEIIQEAEGRFYKALRYILPRVDFNMTRFEQEASSSSGSSGSSAASSFGENATSDRSRPTNYEKKFMIRQPIFSGFKEYAALAAGGAERKQRTLEKKRAEEMLFIDVADSFYACLQARQDLEVLRETHKLLGDRVNELEERATIGRSRESEVYTAKVEYSLIKADLREAEKVLGVMTELLAFYIGREVPEEIEDRELEMEAADLAYYLEIILNRADVQALGEAKTLAEKGIIVAQAGLFPTVTLDGNYYTQREGFQSGTDWDVILTINVPIFDGGETLGNIKEAAAKREEARLAFERSKRWAQYEIRSAHEEFLSAQSREKYFDEALDNAKKSYELQNEEYRLSLVNNLEVLDALKKYQDARIRYNGARYQTKREYWMMKAAAGEPLP